MMRDPARFDRTEFHQGDEVLDLNGDKIGSVSDIGPNFLEVSTGFLGLGEHLYVPFDAVTRVQDHDIFLDVTKDEVHHRGWNQAPAEAAAQEGVLAGTMPAAPAEETRYVTFNTTNPAAIPGGTAPPTPSTWIGPQDVLGKTLVDEDGREIGNINNAGAEYFEVPTGLLNLGPTLYVPFTAISHCTADKCYLNVPIGQIEQQGWNRRPTEAMVGRGAAPGAPIPSAPPLTPIGNFPPGNVGPTIGAPMSAEVEQPVPIPINAEEPEARRFVYENYTDPRFQGLSFAQAEPALRQQWEQTHPNRPWGDVKSDVRNAWDTLTGG
jgi:hypothetical protein